MKFSVISDQPSLNPQLTTDNRQLLWSLLGLVVMARGMTPDPIPNSAVKTLRADGTAS
jgi:hypothetical protein